MTLETFNFNNYFSCTGSIMSRQAEEYAARKREALERANILRALRADAEEAEKRTKLEREESQKRVKAGYGANPPERYQQQEHRIAAHDRQAPQSNMIDKLRELESQVA
jgi:hypothetical protein